jgi:hypothetical protein
MSEPTRAEVQEALRKVRAAIFQTSFAFDESKIIEARAAARRAAIAVTELEIILDPREPGIPEPENVFRQRYEERLAQSREERSRAERDS